MTEPTPNWRIVRGSPTAEELAALVVALTATAAARRPSAPRPTPSAWAAYWQTHRGQATVPTANRPGGWRASALPR